jgi:hypothetical protein
VIFVRPRTMPMMTATPGATISIWVVLHT